MKEKWFFIRFESVIIVVQFFIYYSKYDFSKNYYIKKKIEYRVLEFFINLYFRVRCDCSV